MSATDQSELLQLVVRELSISKADAERWYLQAKLPEFGGLSPVEVVQKGKTAALVAYVKAVGVGGFS